MQAGARDSRHLQLAKFTNGSLGISSVGLDATAKSLKGLGTDLGKESSENCTPEA